MKPALCPNGECDYRSTSPNASLRLEPSSFEREDAGWRFDLSVVCAPSHVEQEGSSIWNEINHANAPTGHLAISSRGSRRQMRLHKLKCANGRID